jgi:uncharacterized protein (TIGR02271 family)
MDIMATKSPLVLGVFQREADVKGALKALEDAGFAKDQVGLALRKEGIVTPSLLHDLVKWGIPEDRSMYYESEYEAGHPVLSVRADGREQEVTRILQQYGAYDQGTHPPAARTTANMTAGTVLADGAIPDGTADEQHALHLRAERLNIDKQSVQTGEVQLHKEVVEEEQVIDVPVNHEEVFIQRRTIEDGRLSDTPIGQDEMIRIPVLEEQVTVTKKAVETGEVAVGKRTVQEHQRVTDTVRHEEARLEKEGNPRIHANEDLLNS